MKHLLLLWVALAVTACSSTRFHYLKSEKGWESVPFPDSEVVYSLFMIGDAGGDTLYSAPVIKGLKQRLAAADPESTGVIFLGDNIYPDGMHKKNHPDRAQDEGRINVQLDAVTDFQGDIWFIPGNHDWNHHGEGGWKQLRREEKYVQKRLDRGNVFRPSKGCPGPDAVKLAPGLVLIIVDTQWWLHRYERPSGEKDGCDVRTPEEFMVQFQDLLKKYRDQNVIVAGHHPLMSNGYHGGHFQFTDHLFPLRALNKKAYVPLPIIGSIYPYYRKFMGHPQDIPHPVYQEMKDQMLTAMDAYGDVIYVAGHEHNLQYAREGQVHHVVSGSGSKLTYLKFDRSLLFGGRERGYTKASYLADGTVWLEFITWDPEAQVEKVSFRKQLYQRDVTKPTAKPEVEKVSYAGQFATVVPDSSLQAGKFKRAFFGDLNRDWWARPLKVPYLDIHYLHGGLRPIKKGGGMQTLSLRLEDPTGKQYILRGVQKNSTFLTGANLRGTLTADLIYDGMAGSHPYAAVVLPPLSKAAGVYHAISQLVYLPDDPILGDYQEEFGGMFCLFEERPNDDMSHAEHFGSSEEVIGYSDAIELMHEKYSHVVDKDFVVRSRLFDVLIGDWDRHDDQWRWATFKQDGQTLYRPIPRDRDQAFFQFDGFFMNIANRKWAVRKFQPFRDEVRDMAGQNFNARYFDRAFLIEATREDWERIARDLQSRLSDEVIEAAIAGFPPETEGLTAPEIVRTLKQRRENLVDFALEYYEILAERVSIPGTLKDDFFEVLRREDGSVELNIYPRKKGRKVKDERYFHRVFQPGETKEIRLYGLDGKDEYKIKGEAKKSILVRIIAGFEKDRVEDESKVRGLLKSTRVYDPEGKIELETKGETKLATRKESIAYDYDRREFKYNQLLPAVSMGFNPNDGIFIGPGVRIIRHGFKKKPYAQMHFLRGNYAFGSQGFNFYYDFDIADVIGRVDLAGTMRINHPLVYPYFGAGNEADLDNNDPRDNLVRMNDYEFSPRLQIASSSRSQILNLAFNGRRVAFDAPPEVPLEPWQVEEQWFGGLGLNYQYQNKNDRVFPTRGFVFKTNALWNTSLNTDNVNYAGLGAEVRLYLPLRFLGKGATLGLRSGFAHNWGDYAFFQANFLSGFQNFRGIQRNRLSGRTSSFHNGELRFKLFRVWNYVLPFEVGILAHGDVARVWEDGESSDRWHPSAGGGLFVNVLDSFLLVGTYSVSRIDRIFSFGTGFFF